MRKTELQRLETFPDPPEHLSERSQELWRALGPTAAKSLGRQVLLQSALESLDRADEARRIIRDTGMISTTTTTGAVHLHPAMRVERESRAAFVRIWDQLGLRWDPKVDGFGL